MRDKIIEDYKILLGVGWLQADDDGNVSLAIGDEIRPATINGKRVILPTREQMKNKNWDNRIGFHPLRESYNLGISDVTANLRDQYVMRLNATIGYAMKELIGIAHDQANQKNLSTEQAEVLNCLQSVSDRTVRDFDDLLKKTKARNDADQFINIFIKRGGTVKGKTYGRAAIVTFPIYDALKRGDEKVNGVKFSVKDREMLVRLFEFIMPSTAVEEGYNQGISSKTAPFLEALIRATFSVVSELVESMSPYLDIVAMPTLLQFPENMGYWLEVFDSKDLAERMQRCIPNLATGEEEEDKPKPAKEEVRREPARSSGRSEERLPEREVAAAPPPPRGRMVMGAAAPMTPTGEVPGKARPDQNRETSGTDRVETGITSGSRAPRRDVDIDREEERKRRELEDRERRELERAEIEARRREEEVRRELELRWEKEDRDRERERARVLGLRDDRDDRDTRRSSRYDERDRDRDDRGRSGDIFDDNPVLRANLRDTDDRDYRRGVRGRSRYDDRDDDRRGRVRDMRDGGRDRYEDRGRDREDRYYDRRDDRRGRYR